MDHASKIRDLIVPLSTSRKVPPVERFESFFARTHVDHPEAVDVIIRLLSTGSTQSKLTIAPRILDHVEYFQNDYDPEQGLNLAILVLELWTIVEVTEEVSRVMPLYDYDYGGTYFMTHNPEEPLRDYYWRGNVAMNIVAIYCELDPEISSSSFVRYAGAHSDIGAVVRTAIERETLDVDTIHYVLTASSSSALALGSGVL